MLGLKKGTVLLCDHQTEWEVQAQQMIALLRQAFGTHAVDIQHVGSTSVKTIAAKPIIDIAVGMESLDEIDRFLVPLAELGVQKSAGQPFSDIVLFSKDDANTGERLFNIQESFTVRRNGTGMSAFAITLTRTPTKRKSMNKSKRKPRVCTLRT